MADTFDGQHKDESIDFVFRQHPVVMRRSMIYGLLALTIGMLPFFLWPLQTWARWVVLAGALVGLVIFGYRFISWYFSVYIITNERLIQIKQKGLFDRNVQDISHSRIQSVQYEIKGLQQTLLKFGTISVQTFAGPTLNMTYIHKPEEVHQHLNKVIRNIPPGDQLDVGERKEHERSTQEAQTTTQA